MKIILLFLVIFYKFRKFFFKLPEFFYWKYQDLKNIKKHGKEFGQFGLRMFCGRQGAGKTVGIVWLLEQWKQKYPKLKIYTNIDYKNQDGELEGWDILLDQNYRNGTDGVVFVIDEIQNEFSSNAWKDFPETLLSELTQQRKQHICIICSSQVFKRVAKQLREQCYQVIECKTFFKRWTRLKAYDADDYNNIIDSNDPSKKYKLPKVWKDSFIQTDYLRSLYDTFKKVERMRRDGFVSKNTA